DSVYYLFESGQNSFLDIYKDITGHGKDPYHFFPGFRENISKEGGHIAEYSFDTFPCVRSGTFDLVPHTREKIRDWLDYIFIKPIRSNTPRLFDYLPATFCNNSDIVKNVVNGLLYFPKKLRKPFNRW